MSIQNEVSKAMSGFDRLIAEAPDGGDEEPIAKIVRNIEYKTGVPKRYRDDWPRPTDKIWTDNFARVTERVKSGVTVALIGNRGTGKTRIAAEAVRDYSPSMAHYTTAMEIFLRIQDSFNKKSDQSQFEITKELATCKMLVIDEVQERGNSAWEDRILTHVIDKRYGATLPTILIANLTAERLIESIGESIASRMNEGGGIIVINGKSHRE